MQEILAPVGNWDMLDAALAAGCDAVYLASKNFGARAYAQNFTLEEIREIIKRCHLVNVKVHVTMNTILFEEEIESAYQVAKQLYEMGVDALIVQDLGLIHLLHHRLPDLSIHASTQMSVMYPEEIMRLKKLGVSRVVLARECTKAEIAACKKAGLEIEIFVHGAICISMSGRCYFSSVCYGRSGNRGMCAQPCRMAYELYEDGQKVATDGKYLLSPKDLSLIDRVKELDVDSLKIEGRMKSSEYVYETVRQVKMVRDGKKRTEQDKELAQQTFYRGYTLGHVYQQTGNDLMNMKTCNHQGIVVGKVLSVKRDEVRILCSKDLVQNDGIRLGQEAGCRINYLYDEKLRLQNRIPAGKVACLKNLRHVKKGDIVRRTISADLEKEVKEAISQSCRKVACEMRVSCKGAGYPLVCEISDGSHMVSIESEEKAELAKNQGLSEKTIVKQMNKTKNSWVAFTKIECAIQGEVFFPLGALNNCRRQAIAALENVRLEVVCSAEESYRYQPIKQELSSRIYIDQVDETCAPSSMNVTNSYGVAAIQEMGYDHVVLSDELTFEQITDLLRAYKQRYQSQAPVIYTIYQRRRLMIMRHCPVNTIIKDGKRQHCALCHQHQFTLRGMDGHAYKMEGNKACFMQIFDTNLTDYTDEIPKLKREGLTSFLCIFSDESESEKESILHRISD